MSKIELIKKWAYDRNLIEGSSGEAQIIKLTEEVGELAAGFVRRDKEKIKDSIGDCMVVLTVISEQYKYNISSITYTGYVDVSFLRVIQVLGELAEVVIDDYNSSIIHEIIERFVRLLITLSEQNNLTIDECIEAAYNEIKDRKGRMIDGVFVKQEDLDQMNLEF